MKDWKDVQSTIERLGNRLTATQVVAALNCLKRMPTRPPEALLHKLCRSAMRLEPQMQPRHVVDVVHACGKMAFIDRPLLTLLAQSIITLPRLSPARFEGRDFGALLHGLAMIQSATSAPVASAPFSRANDPFDSFRELMTSLGAELSTPRRLASLRESHLGFIILGLGRVGRLGPRGPSVIHALASECLKPERAPNLTAAQLGAISDGLRRLRYADLAVVGRLASEASRPERLRSFTSEDLAHVIFAFGSLGVRNYPAAWKLGMEATRGARVRSFDERSLASVLYGLTQLQLAEAGVLDPLLQEVVKPERLANFSGRDFVLVLDGLVAARLRDRGVLGALWREAFGGEGLGRRRVSDWELACMRYSFGKLGVFRGEC
ncbi:unnamed protein product [Ostreobium quekettii]|nr:unnamed protein product [Ostreobium quekettii]